MQKASPRLALFSLGLLLAACATSSPPPKPSASPTPTPTPAPTPVPTPTPIPLISAPVLVQIENLPAARPLSGLQTATLAYEYETEGGISRISALYFNPITQIVGPVRSARTVTVNLLSIYQPTLIYSGASNYVNRLLHAQPQPLFNETNAANALYRNPRRRIPHNLYLSPTGLQALLAKHPLGTVPYQLWLRTPQSQIIGGAPVHQVVVPISSFESPRYTWNPTLSAFTRSETSTGPFINANTGTPLLVSDLIVMPVPITVTPNIEDVNGNHGLDQHLVGSGLATLFVNGQSFAILWTQPPLGPPSFYLTSGAPAPLAPGLIWIDLVHLTTKPIITP